MKPTELTLARVTPQQRLEQYIWQAMCNVENLRDCQLHHCGEFAKLFVMLTLDYADEIEALRQDAPP